MRKCLLAGACAVAITGNSFAQFASDRLPVPPSSPTAVKPAGGVPQLPGGVTPAGGTSAAPRPMLNGFTLDPVRKEPTRPVPTTIDDKAGTHKWTVKPEDGGWMIMVKSYAGADSRQKAEKLAADIRTTHRTNALLFERNVEERKEEQAQVEAVRKREHGKAKEMEQVIEQAKREAEANGSTFLPNRLMVKVPRPYHETPEQWVVFIGGFKTMDEARTALTTVKRLPEPKDTTLMDAGMIGGKVTDARTGQEEFKSAAHHLNPYPSAMVVPNPTLAKQNLEEKAKLDPFVVKLNDGVQHSLLGAKKPWTLLVKSYSMPTRRASATGDPKSVFDRGGKKGASAADMLMATAAEAEAMAKALRHPDMKPRSYEAFVLHHTHGSIVTVGQFEDPEDPQLLKLQQELLDLTFELRDKDKKPVTGPDGRPLVQRLFDGVSLFPVPKY
jgi:hypothetical protein